MSGNWVQRGECAVLDKWARTRAALEGGVDLVLELPTPWAVSSAESFARGAVELLAASGVVTCPPWKGLYSATMPAASTARPPLPRTGRVVSFW